MAKMLSKSDFMKFLQCGKYLWMYKFRKEEATPVDARQQSIFDQGDEVEIYVLQLFKGAVSVDADLDIFEGERQTRVLMEDGAKIIFQPTVITKSTLGTGQRRASGTIMARADIIKYNPKAKAWDIYEIKSTTEVKPEHIPDVAFQKVVFETAGYKINKTYLVHINNKYVRQGEIEPEKLLKIEDISDPVNEMIPEVEVAIPQAFKVLKKKDEPQVRIIRQCGNPYECPFIRYCWTQAKIPDYSVYNLTGVSEKKLIQLLDLGVMEIKDIPDDFPLSKNQEWQVMAEKSGKSFIEKEEFAAALKELKYPIYFLDYETLNPAIPRWDGMHPYQQVCFQYSLHVVRQPEDLLLPENEMEHHEFLPSGKENPVPALLKQLREDIADDGGSVLVWNEGFEKTRNREMAVVCPEYKQFIESVNARVFDLMIPFRKRHFVDPGFMGSVSIKSVLPVLGGGVSYEDIEVGEGSDVGREWFNSVYGGLPAAEIKRIRRKLLAYCGRDTYAMVRVLRTVKEMVE